MPIMNNYRSSSNFCTNNNIIIVYCTSVDSISESACSAGSADVPIQKTVEEPTTDSVINETGAYNVFVDDNFKRQALRQMSIINFKLDQLTEDFWKLFSNNLNSIRIIKNWGVKPQTHDETINGEVNCKYTWNEVQLAGIKKKENFSALNIANIVIESVMKIHIKTTTESDVESAIEGWLVKAKEREKKSQK
ncbi:hypothetical protein JTB14_025961 [Gonioctena quinquepunctata]|nr:hypothetical protein JTB14_025961 [Gonioctena quinquepunctata]